MAGHNDIAESFVVQNMPEGLKRVKKPQRDSRLPITLEILTKIVSVLPNICNSEYEATMFSSAFSSALFALLRVGEVTVATEKAQANSNHMLQIENVQVSASSVNIFLESSKSDQFHEGVNINTSKQSVTKICPVQLKQSYLAIRPPLQGPLFCHYGGKPLTRYQCSSI